MSSDGGGGDSRGHSKGRIDHDTSSTVFQACWGLAVSSLTPLIVGTQFLGWTPTAQAMTWENPCDADPQSDECAYYQSWLQGQDLFWLAHWGAPYVNGQSVMTLEQVEPDRWYGDWDVTVWLDAGLDYENPDLTEQDVLDQIVGMGTLKVSYVGLLTWDMDEHTDPDDGVVTTVTALTTIVAGMLTGQTGVSSPVLANIVQLDASNTLGDAQRVYQFGVVEVTDTLEDAESAALVIAEAASDIMESNGSGGSGEGGIGTPPRRAGAG